MTDEAAKFRKELEERTGETVREVAMASLLDYDEGGPENKVADSFGGDGEWGLLVLTDRSLRFSRPPSRHWLASLFRPQKRDEPIQAAPDIVVPLAEGTAIELPKRSLASRLFGPGYQRVLVTWPGVSGPSRLELSIDPRGPMPKALAAIASTTN